MKNSKASIAVTLLTSFSMLAALCVGNDGVRRASAQTSFDSSQTTDGGADKVSADLREIVQDSAATGSRVRVIIQHNGAMSAELESFLLLNGADIRSSYTNFDLSALMLPARLVQYLSSFGEVKYISSDRKIESLGHVEITTGAAEMRQQEGNGGLTRKAIGIAVLDSGIYKEHQSFSGRVLISKDFTRENRTDDPYGHGTHVAGLAAGNGVVERGAHTGVAPEATLINLRVLNSRGNGSTSDLLSALDWVMTNRKRYNIRVVNLSLGAPAIDSYKVDPLCRAVRRLVNSGVTVVTAAGNDGKLADGRKVYGQIHSPGIEPSAITVGATKTFTTDARDDDRVTSFSSRGPTRGFWTDESGVKRYDNIIKPDVVAPGNKLISASAKSNNIASGHPELILNPQAADNQQVMRLSGTSAATTIPNEMRVGTLFHFRRSGKESHHHPISPQSSRARTRDLDLPHRPTAGRNFIRMVTLG